MVVDRYGREIAYPGRKPSKWNVGFEIYGELQHALDRADQIKYDDQDAPLPAARHRPRDVRNLWADDPSNAPVVAVEPLTREELLHHPVWGPLASTLGQEAEAEER